MYQEHLLWNGEKEQFENIHKIRAKRHEAIFVCIPSKNIILMLGGYDPLKNKAIDTIYSYDLKNKKWNLLPQKLPVPLAFFGYVLSDNEKYLIIMGGTMVVNVQTNRIWVMDVDNMQFKKCTIRCPAYDNYHAISMNDGFDADLLTFGYIRDVWKLSEFSSILYPPEGLIKLMATYCSTEFIHLIAWKGNHCKIALIDILQNY